MQLSLVNLRPGTSVWTNYVGDNVFLFSLHLGFGKDIRKILPWRESRLWQWLLLKIASSLFVLGIACRLAGLCVHEWKEDAQSLGRSKGFLSCGEQSLRGAGCRQPRATSDSPGEGKGPVRDPRASGCPLMGQGSAAHSWRLGLAFSGGWGCRELQGWPVEGCSHDFNLPILFKPMTTWQHELAQGVVSVPDIQWRLFCTSPWAEFEKGSL